MFYRKQTCFKKMKKCSFMSFSQCCHLLIRQYYSLVIVMLPMVLGDNGFSSSRITNDVPEYKTKVVLSNPISSSWINTNLSFFFIVSRRHYSFVTFRFFVHSFLGFFSNTPVHKFSNIVYQFVILHSLSMGKASL